MNKEFTKAADILKQSESEKQQETSQKEGQMNSSSNINLSSTGGGGSDFQEKSNIGNKIDPSDLHYKDSEGGNKRYTSNVDKEMKQAKDIESNIESNSAAPQWRL
ncbi:hypothetical protein C9374_012896 [Naegleria lovaniensis]|uniref:Uncharacterized protein n=1 Tax=Naegleria lovaniensis TaxID=51637 RepID=A0AA88G6M8_NAELO|nr:uncharacterized protein C9374_012896 [Naegleria lovaniensis]KAG2373050.1 hypothetical protein C9374_012896 [Naegleria lovaniensis]